MFHLITGLGNHIPSTSPYTNASTRELLEKFLNAPSRELNQFALVQPVCIFMYKMRRKKKARGDREKRREMILKIKTKFVNNFHILSPC